MFKIETTRIMGSKKIDHSVKQGCVTVKLFKLLGITIVKTVKFEQF